MAPSLPYLRVILPRTGGELNPTVEATILDFWKRAIPQFYCGKDKSRCEAFMGRGETPDEVSCILCGEMWFGYVIDANHQQKPGQRRARLHAERSRMPATLTYSQLRNTRTA